MKTTSSLTQLMQFMYVDNMKNPVRDAEWPILLGMLATEDMKPQIYTVLAGCNKLKDIPQDVAISLKEGRDQAIYQNLIVKKHAERLLREFDSSGIPTIWMKGLRFAERYFGHIAARMTSDIDILVPTSWSKVASDILTQKLGYRVVESYRPDHFHIQFHRVSARDGIDPVIVELHHHVVEDKRATVNLDPFFHSAELLPGYSNIMELSEHQTFYFACIHAGNHGLEHLKHFLDIIHLLCRQGSHICLPDVVDQAIKDKTINMVAAVLSSVYEDFPFLSEFHSLPKELRRFWTIKRIHSSRLFQITMLSGFKRRIRLVIDVLFPSRFDAIRWAELSYETKKPICQIYLCLYFRRIKRMFRGGRRTKYKR